MKQGVFDCASCERVCSYLDSYIGDELLVETNAKIQRHLQDCRECAAELKGRERLKNLLQRATRAEVVPPELGAKIRAGIRANSSAGMFSQTGLRLAVATLLIAVSCVSIWKILEMRQGEQNTEATLQVALNPAHSEQTRHVLSIGLEDHIHCAVANGSGIHNFGFNNSDLGVEYAGLIPTVKENLGGDYQIVATHICLVNTREFAHLILRNRDRTVSVILTEKNGEAFSSARHLEPSGAPLYNGRTKDYSVTGFETNQHLAFVASYLNAEENAYVASKIAPAVRHLLSLSQTVSRNFESPN